MDNIEISDRVYKVHPIYDLYASDKEGKVVNIVKKVPHMGNSSSSGYLKCSVRKYGGNLKYTTSIGLFGNVIMATYQKEK